MRKLVVGILGYRALKQYVANSQQEADEIIAYHQQQKRLAMLNIPKEPEPMPKPEPVLKPEPEPMPVLESKEDMDKLAWLI